MDSKIKYVDANGLRIFAEELKQQLKNHVMETGIFNTIANRVEKLENLEIFEICQELPEKGMENKIYLVDDQSSSSGFTMYIWVDNDWKNKGAFETTFDLKNYVFEKGTSENSIVLKGSDNKVGLKGYYISGIKKDVIEEPYGKLTIAISDVSGELVDNVDTLLNYNIQHTYNKGDIASFQLGNIFTNIGEIIDVNANIIQVKLNKEITLGDQDPELRHYFWVGSKWYDGVIDLGQYAVSFGTDNKSLAFAAYTEGWENSAYGKYSHVEGKQNEAHYCSHAEGSNNKAFGNTSHVEGTDNIASNSNAHAEGRYTSARGYASHAEGYGESVEINTEASGEGAHAEGRVTKAQGNYSHTEGQYTSALGIASHAEGKGESQTNPNKAEGNYSHVEGEKTKASGVASHSEGMMTEAIGKAAHSEGRQTKTTNDYTHAEGYLSEAGGIGSHSEGVGTQTKNNGEHAEGRFNKSNSVAPNEGSNPKNTLHSVGIGTSDTDRTNAHEIMQDGKHYILGVGNYDGKKLDGAQTLQEVISEKAEKSEIPTEFTVSNWGFTKNKGTITDIKANGVSLTQNNGEVNITAADLDLASALKYCGITTTNLTDYPTTNPVVIDGENHIAEQGCVVFYEDNGNIKEFVFNGTKWELLGSNLTYNVVQNVDMPIVKGDVENSAVLKGEYTVSSKKYYNKAVSQTSMAVGGASNAGLKGWYYSGIDFTNNKIYLSKTQPNSIKTSGFTTDTSITLNDIQGPEEGLIIKKRTQYIAGDSISIVCESKYENQCKITSVEPGIITVDKIPFTSDVLPSYTLGIGKQPDDFTLYSIMPEVNSTTKQLTVRNWNQGGVDLGGASLAEGANTYAVNVGAHAEGIQTVAYGQYSHAEGFETKAGYAAHAEGRGTKADGEESHAEGRNTTASGKHSHAEGDITEAMGVNAHAEGYLSKASGNSSHAEGGNWVKGATGAARINGGTAEGAGSHAEGGKTTAIADYSHAEGYRSVSSGPNSHSEGQLTRTGGEDADRPTGNPGTKSGQNAHAEGAVTFAQGAGSHAEGGNTWASGNYSHTEGWQTRTHPNANNSHAEGFYTEVYNRAEHASGQYNKSTKSDDKAEATHFSIGIGTSDSENGRKNAIEVKQNGDVYITGIGGFTGANSDSSKSVQEVISKLVNKFNERTTND